MAKSTSKTLSIPEAGRVYFGLGRDASYTAAKKGQFPVIWVGRIGRVPIAAMERLMEHPQESQTT